MGIIQKQALQTTVLSSIGLVIGYINKAVLFLILLSPSQVGLVNLTVTVALLFSQFSNLGTIYSIWRFFPFFRSKEKDNYGFLKFNMLIILFGILLTTSSVLLFKDQIFHLYDKKSPLFVEYYLWIIPIGIAHVYFVLFDNFLRGLYRNLVSVFANEIVLRLIITVLLFLLYRQIITFHLFFILHAFAYFIPLLVVTIYLIKLKELNFNFKSIYIPKRFQKILIYFSGFSYINTLAVLLVISMDAMMIAHYLDLKSTGIYTTMIYLTSAVMIPYRSMVRVSSPLVAELWKKKELNSLQKLYQKSSSIGLVMALFIFLIIWIPINDFFYFIPEYKEGMYVFIILLIGRLVDMYCGLNGTIFSTSRKYKYDLLFSVFLCLSVFVLNLWLIPKYGILGAAISTSLAYIIYNILRTYYIYFSYGLFPFKKSQIKIISFFSILLVSFILFFHWVQLEGNSMETTLLVLILKVIVVSILFIIPVIALKMEESVNTLFYNLLNKLRFNKATSGKNIR